MIETGVTTSEFVVNKTQATNMLENSTENENKRPIAIIGAMAQEVTILIDHMENQHTDVVAGVHIHHGEINNRAVVVLQSGIGKVNATIATSLVIDRFKPVAVINTGSAGGIADGLKVGDVVIGNSVAHHDVNVTAFGYQIGQMAQMPVDYQTDASLASTIKTVAQAKHTDTDSILANATIHSGMIVSGDQFVTDSEHFTTIRTYFPKAMAVEMEAAAIAQTCYLFDTPFVVVRVISDLADEDASISFDEFIEQAGKYSAQIVIDALQSL